MKAIEKIQNWYKDQCNGDWEHQFGVIIETLDSPGWLVRIDILGTDLEKVKFEEVSYGVGKDSEPNGENWVNCKVEENTFVGFGGPRKLEEILQIFLTWANESSEQTLAAKRRQQY